MTRKITTFDLFSFGVWLLASMLFSLPAAAQQRVLRKQVVVDAPLKQVWEAFTTTQGAETFFAPKANVNPTLGGSYEMYFNPNGPRGERGCEEGCRVQSITPMKSLAFSWSNEPVTKTLRAAGLVTIVYLDFKELSPNQTLIHFTNVGWGEGDEWDASYKTFKHDWDVVLGRLKLRFAKGPIDWKHPPEPTESLAVAD
jgi:uncharacterized protein YndB with AHSA1/START domain